MAVDFSVSEKVDGLTRGCKKLLTKEQKLNVSNSCIYVSTYSPPILWVSVQSATEIVSSSNRLWSADEQLKRADRRMLENVPDLCFNLLWPIVLVLNS